MPRRTSLSPSPRGWSNRTWTAGLRRSQSIRRVRRRARARLVARWQASDGSQWSLERVAGMEARENLGESACGGSHRLVGLVVARDRHLAAGGTLTGEWAEVDYKIKDAVQTARLYQQQSGSFSTNYFERPGSSPDVGLQISTTGHTLEFLTYALNDEDLKGAWVARAVSRLCHLLRQTQDMPLECGGLYHTAHGLLLYRERRFGKES